MKIVVTAQNILLPKVSLCSYRQLSRTLGAARTVFDISYCASHIARRLSLFLKDCLCEDLGPKKYIFQNSIDGEVIDIEKGIEVGREEGKEQGIKKKHE